MGHGTNRRRRLSPNTDLDAAPVPDMARRQSLRYPAHHFPLRQLHVVRLRSCIHRLLRVRRLAVLSLACLFIDLLAPAAARSEPFIAPGRTELRVDLQALADAGVVAAPVTAWPISWQSIIGGLEDVDVRTLTPAARAALDRVRSELRLAEQTHRVLPHVRVGATSEPALLRSFTATPRDDGELEGGIAYTGDRLSVKLDVTRTFDADAPDDWRFDGSYVGFAVRHWGVIAGFPERWWGPGIQGSLILSTNARPIPQIGVERISAEGFERPWLRWIGPWTVSSFIGELDDERVVDRAKLFGLRFTARPLPQLQIGFSRTAQLCGNGRPCGLEQFTDMLIGHDNRGVNVDPEAEPGNQLAGLDGRWAFSGQRFAVYWQWIGEDSRRGGPQIGDWLRLLGGELSGPLAGTGWRHRTYLEYADTTCQEGGIGFGGAKYRCAYEHSLYRSGYRYEGRALGYPTDTDSQSLAVVSILQGPGTGAWELAAHAARVNQGPAPTPRHSLSVTPARLNGIDVTHVRDLPVGRLRLRLSLSERTDELSGVSNTDADVAVEWMVGYW